jgi:hypothetical protein
MAVDFQARDHMLSLDSLRVYGPRVNQGTLTRSRINSAAASESSDDDWEWPPNGWLLLGLPDVVSPNI